MDVLAVLLQAAFFLVFAATAWAYVRRRRQLELDLVAIFATNAATFSVAFVSAVDPQLGSRMGPWAVAVFLAQPYLVVRLIDHVRPLPRGIAPLVAAGFVVAAVSSLVVGARQPVVLVSIVGYFVIVEAAAAARIYTDSRLRIGLPRFRLQLAAAATALFAISIFLAGTRSASGGASTQVGAGLLTLSRLGVLLAGLGYLGAFAPPGWLRRAAQRSVAFDVARSLVPDVADDRERPWHALADAAREILGAPHVAIRRAEGSHELLAEAGVAAPSTPASAGGSSVVEAAVVLDGSRVATLRATIDGRPLFVEDDIWLLEMLGALTARAVERDRALLELGEANRALAATAAVRTSEARFRAFLDADPNAMFAVSGDGRIAWATRMAGELFGTQPDALIDRRFEDLVPTAEADLHEDSPGERLIRRGESEARRVDGSTFPAEVAVADFELDGGPYQIAVVADASWRHEAAAVRERFLGVLSHELRTPVTSIVAGSQLLMSRWKRLEPAVREEVLSDVAAEADRLSRMVENLLVLARAERGGELFEPRPVLVSRLVPALIEREQRLWPGLTIAVSIESPLPMVAADEEYLGHVLRNLISNAAKYGGPSGQVGVTVSGDGQTVTIRVADRGPGIAEADAERLFDLYYRSPSLAATASGAGIGLFVCREIVRQMGGRIWAHARPEGGAEFAFSVPVYADDGRNLAPSFESRQTAADFSTGEFATAS